jgi:hypothetical protein
MTNNLRNKELIRASEGVAEKTFQPSDYAQQSDIAQGLAITHEQMGDANFEGTIDKKDEKENRT